MIIFVDMSLFPIRRYEGVVENAFFLNDVVEGYARYYATQFWETGRCMPGNLRLLHVIELPEDDKLRDWNQLALLERIQNDFMINTLEKFI